VGALAFPQDMQRAIVFSGSLGFVKWLKDGWEHNYLTVGDVSDRTKYQRLHDARAPGERLARHNAFTQRRVCSGGVGALLIQAGAGAALMKVLDRSRPGSNNTSWQQTSLLMLMTLVLHDKWLLDSPPPYSSSSSNNSTTSTSASSSSSSGWPCCANCASSSSRRR